MSAVKTKVHLVGKAIAVIRCGTTSKIVIFCPHKKTLDLVGRYQDEDIELSIEDVNGVFVPELEQRIIDYNYEDGNDTMIVETENQI